MQVKKQILFSLIMMTLATVVPSSSVFASETRLSCLGEAPLPGDEATAFAYPSTANFFDMAMAELGTYDNQQAYAGIFGDFGFHYGFFVSRDRSLIMNQDNPDVFWDYMTAFSTVTAFLSKGASNADTNGILPTPDRVIDVFIGEGATRPKSGWGLRLTYASYINKAEVGLGSVKNSADQLDATAGFTTDASGQLDISIKAGLLGDLKRSTDNGVSSTDYAFKRNTSLAALLRHEAKLSSTTARYVKFGLTTMKPTISSSSPASDKNATFNEQKGDIQVGAEISPIPDALIVVGGGAFYQTSQGPTIRDGGVKKNKAADVSFLAKDDKDEIRAYGLLMNFGMETRVYSALGIMAGLDYPLWGKYVDNNQTLGTPTKTEASLPDTPDSALWKLGIFIKADRLRIDASYGKDFLHNGPNFVSGIETANKLFGQISATYTL